MSKTFSTNVGDLCVIWISGDIDTYIAEVVRSYPLTLKVLDHGLLAFLERGEFIVLENDTSLLQKDFKDGTMFFIQGMQDAGRKVFSGLSSLGVTDGKLREIVSPE